MSKCCPILCSTSSPLFIPPLIPWSTLSASFLFPSPDLAHHPALCWLFSILLFSLTIPSLLFPPLLSFFLHSSTFFTQQSLYSTSIQLSFFYLFRLMSFLCLLWAFWLISISLLSASCLPSSQTLSHFSQSSHSHHLSHLLIHFLLPLSSFYLLFSTILLYCSSFSHTFN